MGKCNKVDVKLTIGGNDHNIQLRPGERKVRTPVIITGKRNGVNVDLSDNVKYLPKVSCLKNRRHVAIPNILMSGETIKITINEEGKESKVIKVKLI